MERNYYTEGFESFLKDKADQYKLYPSENVWRKIDRRLHPRFKWSYLTVFLLFLGFSTALVNSLVKQPVQSLATVAPVTGSSSESNLQKDFISEPGESSSLSNNNIPNSIFKAIKGGISSQVSSQDKEVATVVPDFSIQRIRVAEIFTQAQTTNNNPAELVTNEVLDAVPGEEFKLVSETLFRKDLNGNESIQSASRLPSSLILATEKQFEVSNPEINTPAVKDDKNFDIRNLIKGKWGIQFYVTPSVSYRKLSGSATKGTYSYSGIAYSANFGYPSDVNDAVTHTPSIGLEVGTAMIKNLSRNFRFKAGIQFNYNQYDVKAYSYVPELAPYGANFNGFVGSPLNVVSHYRNFDGYAPTWLKNKHFMISMPVGMEWSVIGNSRVQFNIAGTLQPTYNINNEAFLISTNLKNYAEEPSLYRKWNVSTAIETFLSLNTGSLKWVVGPQFRYQILSTFKDNYPIKEHLLDYGIKVGVNKTLR